jgi:hypothetical protein
MQQQREAWDDPWVMRSLLGMSRMTLFSAAEEAT